MELNTFHKVVEAINTYYAFALLLYAITLYLVSHSHLFVWVALLATPLLAGWTGYVAKSLVDRRRLRHGFHVLNNTVTYEIGKDNHYTLLVSSRIKAGYNRLMVYPIAHQWSGAGVEAVPQILSPGHELLAQVKRSDESGREARIMPYTLTSSVHGDWNYWFVAFNPPAHKGDVIDIKYRQTFHDKRGVAKPRLYHLVRVPMKRLELRVKFPRHMTPQSVQGMRITPEDSKQMIRMEGAQYDPDTQWATWTIKRPKVGNTYIIQWR